MNQPGRTKRGISKTTKPLASVNAEHSEAVNPTPATSVTCNAGELDLQLAISRHKADLLDQAADGDRGFLAELRAVQLLMQPGDLVAVDLGQVGMKSNGLRRR